LEELLAAEKAYEDKILKVEISFVSDITMGLFLRYHQGSRGISKEGFGAFEQRERTRRGTTTF